MWNTSQTIKLQSLTTSWVELRAGEGLRSLRISDKTISISNFRNMRRLKGAVKSSNQSCQVNKTNVTVTPAVSAWKCPWATRQPHFAPEGVALGLSLPTVWISECRSALRHQLICKGLNKFRRNNTEVTLFFFTLKFSLNHQKKKKLSNQRRSSQEP